MKRTVSLACALLVGLASFAQAEQGNPKIESIEAIAFGPNGLLLIGGKGRVVAVETGDTKETTWTKTEIANIDQVLAAKLGLGQKDIEIKKIAVNPASRKAYVAVRSLKASKNPSVILTIDGTGTIGEFSLDNVKYESYTLSVPNLAVTRITDMTWAAGKIVAATQATDKFSSRVFTINPAAKGALVNVSTETYHVGHGKWETKAPILCIMPFEENGKTSVVGSFTCTPIVKYAIDDQKPNAQVKGTSVLELGTGNTPRSMFAYERDGKRFILVNVARNNKKPAFDFPSAYWVARVDAELLKETTNINEKAPWRIGGKGPKAGDRVSVAKDYFGVYQMDRLDATRALVIQEQKGAFTLRAVPLP